MREIAYVSPFYLNGNMLKAQLRTWERYAPDVLARYRFIIVDDASPGYPAAEIIKSNASAAVLDRIEVYRIADDIPWNQHGARNLGAHVAPNGWLLLTDIDHQLMAEDARQLATVPLDEGWFYYLRRVKAGAVLETERRHCNSFVVTRAAFLASGGYDEDFCGSYGGDGQLTAALAIDTTPGELDTVSLVRYPREVIADASTTTLDRKGAYRDEYLSRLKSKPRIPYKAVGPLRFAWERAL